MTHSINWDANFEASPDNDNYGYEIDDFNRELKMAVRERMEQEHYWKESMTKDGEHIPGECKIIYVGAKSTFPTAKAGCAAIATDEQNKFYFCTEAGTWTELEIFTISNDVIVAEGKKIDNVDISAHAEGTAKEQHAAGVGDHTHKSEGAEGGNLSLDALTHYDSGWFAVGQNTTYTKAHGLEAVPRMVQIFIAQNSNGSGWCTLHNVNLPDDQQLTLVELTSVNVVLRSYTYICNFRDKNDVHYRPTAGYCRIIAIK